MILLLISNSDLDAVDRALEPDALPSTAKLYYILRLLMNVFMQNVSSLSNKPSSIREFKGLSYPMPELLTRIYVYLTGQNGSAGKDNIAKLLGSCLDELCMLINISPARYKVDLLAIYLKVFTGRQSEIIFLSVGKIMIRM